MKQQLLILFFAFVTLEVFSQKSYRKEADTRKGPMDILEYCFIIPGQPYDGSPDPGLSEFEFRKKYLRPIPGKQMLIDSKNAFI